MQGVGAGREAQMLADGVERSQGVQGQPSSVDKQSVLTSLKAKADCGVCGSAKRSITRRLLLR
jgi:hypothetical protein